MARPTKFRTAYITHMKAMFPGLTPRGLNDRIHAQQAFNVLFRGPRFYWLTGLDNHHSGTPRWRILTELGRMLMAGTIGDDDLIDLALGICDEQPRTIDCVRWLKSKRSIYCKFNALQLSETVSVTILKHYADCNKTLTVEQMDVIFDNVRCMTLGEPVEPQSSILSASTEATETRSSGGFC